MGHRPGTCVCRKRGGSSTVASSTTLPPSPPPCHPLQHILIALCPAIISITAAVDPAAPSSNPVAAAAQFLFLLLFVRCYWIGSVVGTGLHYAHPLVLLAEQLLTVAATIGSIGPSCRSQFMQHPLTVARLDVAYIWLQPLTLFCQPLLLAGRWSRGGRTAADRCVAGGTSFLYGG